MAALLEVDNLSVIYRTSGGDARAVDGVSFTIETGQYLGLVGELGCGKSTIAKALLGIVSDNGRVEGSIRLGGLELTRLSPEALRQVRWRDIALVPQSAMNGFDPVYTVNQQLREAIDSHRRTPAPQREERIRELAALVGLPEARLADYPHQFSGGMRQRAMIAMSMVLDPALIVADEPTTGLDVIVQDQIMRRIREIHERLGKSMLLITHDMALVAENCDRIAVMYAGRLMEIGGEGVFTTPYHPYTMGLCNAFPERADRSDTLISIAGQPPDLTRPPAGCRFHERCPFASAECVQREPPLHQVADGHFAACHHAGQATRFREQAKSPQTWKVVAAPT